MFLTTPGRDAAADFVGVAFGVEGEEAGEDFVAEVGGPEQAALVGVVVLVGLVEEDRRGARGKVAPAIGFQARRGPWRRAACAGAGCPLRSRPDRGSDWSWLDVWKSDEMEGFKTI